MKYMITGQRNLVPDPTPEQWVALIQASKQHHLALLEDGTLDCAYGFIEGTGGFVIANADSHEEAQRLLVQYPMLPFYDWEVNPLCDLISAYDNFSDFFSRQIG
jgi:muconolactone delta-isomerase